VKASHTLATFRTLTALVPGRVAEIEAALPREVRDGLAAASGVDLLPAAWDVAVVRAIDEVLGRDGMRRVARATMVESLSGPLLGNLLSTALRLFGASPGAILGWAGRAFGHVTLDCGTLRLTGADEASARLVLEGMEPAIAQPAYVDAIGATMESIFDVCRVTGSVTAEPRPFGARYEARWTPKG
jgi:hypothetical protein